ncbi:MAG: ankyrin repeat domain-containing protein [Planctomycetes bacterium]|nr:ankyrin repeat domain-containing protein [Planctomycetota bacterium]
MGSRRRSIRLLCILVCGLVVPALAGCTNLYNAALEGSRKDARAALQRGDDINGTYTSSRRTPLHAAAHRGHRKMAIFLCDENADPDVQDLDGNTPLHLAARRGHTRTLYILLSAGADPKIRNKNGMTARDMAAAHPGTIDALRDAGG